MTEITVTIRKPIECVDKDFHCECKGYKDNSDIQICETIADCIVIDHYSNGLSEDAHWHAFHEHIIKEWISNGSL